MRLYQQHQQYVLYINTEHAAVKYWYNYFSGELFLVFILATYGLDIGQALNCRSSEI